MIIFSSIINKCFDTIDFSLLNDPDINIGYINPNRKLIFCLTLENLFYKYNVIHVNELGIDLEWKIWDHGENFKYIHEIPLKISKKKFKKYSKILLDGVSILHTKCSLDNCNGRSFLDDLSYRGKYFFWMDFKCYKCGKIKRFKHLSWVTIIKFIKKGIFRFYWSRYYKKYYDFHK